MDTRGELGSDPSEETSVTAATVLAYVEPLLPDDDTAVTLLLLVHWLTTELHRVDPGHARAVAFARDGH